MSDSERGNRSPSVTPERSVVEPTIPIRVLLCNPGLDGHDRGVKVVARSLRDAGMEVIYLPLRTSVDEVAQVAVQEDVDVIGISNLSTSLVGICARLRERLAEADVDDMLIIAGGTVLAEDRKSLALMGISGVFGPGSNTRDIVEFIRSHVPHEHRRGPLRESRP